MWGVWIGCGRVDGTKGREDKSCLFVCLCVWDFIGRGGLLVWDVRNGPRRSKKGGKVE